MAKYGAPMFYHAFLILLVCMNFLCTADLEHREVSIVYFGSPPDGVYTPLSYHRGILQRVVQRNSIENLLVRSYRRSFNGFAAKLTDKERQQLANMKEVVSVFPSRTYQLQTTRTWDFMGFYENVDRNATVESDVVVGVIDSGICPESESFTDKGFSPPPKRWKGSCNGGKNFTCNKKIIGARYYAGESARDEIGHGSHTASTAAGNVVKDVSFYGLAQGTARGGVPAARIAAYKVCDPTCRGHDILAAFDDAIADGVGIITISIGYSTILPLDEDAIAIGAFHAMQKGILTANSAGNNGPFGGTISSLAPWVMTVSASSIDRRIIDKVVLGNGTTVVGNSVNTFTFNGTSFPLVHGKDVSHNCTDIDAGKCEEGCLDSDLVRGKIVLCDEYATGMKEAYKSGALGSVLYSFQNTSDLSLIPPLASTILYKQQYGLIMSYMKSTRDPRGTILKSELSKDPSAPIVAHFSSRGPNQILPEIIKPDISAPGVQVLAAYSPNSPISTRTPEDPRRVKYNVLSGTSMACPHAAGAAAYVKSFRPYWSPAAIKSSLMTTAWPMNDTNRHIATYEFGYGSGHINPVQAINPGLVYEATKEDYIKLLCLKYDEARVRLLSGDNSTCPTGPEKGSPLDHNYPSMGAKVEPLKQFTVRFHRRVKNVGLANSTYKAKIFSNSTVDIKVAPEVLSFESLNEEKAFDVTVVGGGLPYGSPSGPQVSAALVWSDGVHNVRSPIVVYTAALPGSEHE